MNNLIEDEDQTTPDLIIQPQASSSNDNSESPSSQSDELIEKIKDSLSPQRNHEESDEQKPDQTEIEIIREKDRVKSREYYRANKEKVKARQRLYI